MNDIKNREITINDQCPICGRRLKEVSHFDSYFKHYRCESCKIEYKITMVADISDETCTRFTLKYEFIKKNIEEMMK